ncbi:MAG: hypothetical protein J3T61_00275 [Candidatus Brocadiales bacterium]|nr:hypothetical protein [Candidatus Bathyanammoxibius sp.]
MTSKSTPTIWFTNNIHSKTVCGALAEGTGFPLRHADEACDMPGKNPGPSIVYGLLRGCSEIIQRCMAADENYWHIDHGYIGRCHYDGYYRITKNGLQEHPTTFRPGVTGPVLNPPRRTNYDLKPWRKGGKYVVLIPPTLTVVAHTQHSSWWAGRRPCSWEGDARRSLEIYHKGHRVPGKYKYELIVSTKSGPTFDDLKGDALAVVTKNSNAAIDALIYGIPAYQTDGVLGDFCGTLSEDSCKGIWGNPEQWLDWRKGGKPFVRGKPDREPFLNWLTNQQFTLDEMRSGEAWKLLEKQHEYR